MECAQKRAIAATAAAADAARALAPRAMTKS